MICVFRVSIGSVNKTGNVLLAIYSVKYVFDNRLISRKGEVFWPASLAELLQRFVNVIQYINNSPNTCKCIPISKNYRITASVDQQGAHILNCK